MEDILQRLKYEDLNPEQQDFADLVGLDIFKELVRKCGGTYMYIPKEDNIFCISFAYLFQLLWVILAFFQVLS